MSRINTNPSSLIAQRNLMANNKGLNATLERLSTGLRINRGKDDPAGLIASENLRSEKTALSAAISNSERADQMVNIAEGGLAEVNNLLTELRGLVTSTANNAGLSVDEKNANQLQVDSILQTIDRISDATNFQGSKLLNGNLDFTTNNVSAGVSDYRINAAKVPTGGNIAVKAQVTASAQHGSLWISGVAALATGGGLFTIEVGGATGSREFSFASGATMADIATAITSFKDALGVSAATSGNYIKIKSTDFGSDNFVSVKVVNASGVVGAIITNNTLSENLIGGAGSTPNTFASTAAVNGVRDLGQDVAATVNGLVATGKGKTLRVNSDGLDTEITLTTAKAQSTAAALNVFTITGGGATFQLSSKVDITGKVSLGIQNVASRKLGNSTLGFLSSLASGKANNVSSGNLTAGAKIVEEAIRSISGLRGRLGAFQKNVISSTINNLNVSLENSSAAESVIRDADFAAETANLTRGQILAQAAGNSLGLANAQPQQALQLLRG